MPNPTGDSSKSSRPNAIVIMVDDMGFSDIGCYGGDINTPNLDALGYNGIRFTQMYNGARAALPVPRCLPG